MTGASLALLAAVVSSVAPVQVAVTVRSGAATEPPPSVLRLRAAAEAGAYLDTSCPVAEPCTVALAPGMPWTLEVTDEDWWSVPQRVTPELGTPVSLVLEVWPAGRVRGLLVPPEGETEVPATVSLRATGQPGAITHHFPDPLEVSCPVADGRFACRVPVGTWDLGLRAAGFVSFYRWGVPVTTGTHADLGTLKLRRGASLVGKVEAFDGQDISERTRLMLAPESLARVLGGPEAARGRLRAERRGLGPDGFFQFEGLSPGVYALVVSHPSYAPALVFPLEVAENAETELRRPVVLDEPLVLRVRIVPARAPDGGDWRVELSRQGLRPDRWLPASPSQTSVAGEVEWSRLPAGNYLVQIYDPAGSRWASERVELSGASADHEIRLGRVAVAGRVRVGRTPLAASVVFGGLSGEVTIRAESDEDGRFACVLPHSGRWRVGVKGVGEVAVVRDGIAVEVPEPAADGGPVRVDITLPEGAISGTVVAADGKPRAGATVRAAHPQAGPGVVAQAESESDGSFRLLALPAEPLWLWATAGNAKSDQLLVVVQGNSTTSGVQLRLQERRHLVGRVVGPANPVIAAHVVVLPVGTMFVEATTTEPDGSFAVEVPAATRQFTVLVMATGHALYWGTHIVDAGQPLSVALEAGGGTLRLRLPGRDREIPEGSTPVLARDGVPIGLAMLFPWLAAHGIPFTDLETRGLPHMPGGSYSACLLPPQALAALMNGLLSGGNCTSGFLSGGGELLLTFPEPQAAEGTHPPPSH